MHNRFLGAAGNFVFGKLGFLCESVRFFVLAEHLYTIALKFAQLGGYRYVVAIEWYQIALTHYFRGDEKAAFLMLKKRIAEEPQDSIAYLSLAMMYEFTDHRELALINCQKALSAETEVKMKRMIQDYLDRLREGNARPSCPL
jgi:tetratricopeptide (TPR) repeat protein